MKNRVKNIVLDTIALVAIFVLATSCQHKDLCYYHPHVAPVKVMVDWEKANVNAADVDGMTAHLFAMQEMEQKISTTVTTHNPNEITFDVLEGKYSVSIFNYTPDEYATLKFFDLEDYDNASVQVTEVSASKVAWFTKYNVKSKDKYIANQPENIASGKLDDITVSPEMVTKAEKEYIDGGFKMAARTASLAGTVYPESLVYTFKVRVILQGMESYRTAKAIVSGLTIGRKINFREETLDETVSHYLDSWKFVAGSDTPDDKGEIEGTMTCFGLPRGFKFKPEDIQLSLQITLRDGAHTIFPAEGYITVQIGHLIEINEEKKEITMKEAILIKEPLPYVKPEDGEEGGFDVGIEDWEKEEIEILNH